MLNCLRPAVFALFFATPLAAQELVLAVGNELYGSPPDLDGGTEPVLAAADLRDLGIEVIDVRDADLRQMRSAVSRFVQSAPEADRLLVVLAGHFIHTAADTYFLPVDFEDSSVVTLPLQTLPVSVLTAVLAEAPGRSLLILASEERETDLGPYLQAGTGEIDPPSGVVIAQGAPRAASELIRDVVARPGRSLVLGAELIGGIAVSGEVDEGYSFIDGPTGQRSDDLETALQAEQDWEQVRRSDTIAAYEEFIDTHPRSRFVPEARERLEAIRSDPVRQAEIDERAFDLSRDERRQIQRDLVMLGYDTRGIDGIFGEGTRGAIRSWQRSSGYEVTGILTGRQIEALARESSARAAELEREAEERRAEQARLDRAFWLETGALGTEQGYRRYLERYPDGMHAETALDELAAIEEQVRLRAGAADRAAWREARDADTRGAYQRYLSSFPDGAFAAEARQRLQRADGGEAAAAEQRAAAGTERALGLNPLTARLVETRLEALGLRPGPVDGTLDERTRRAIRRYQDQRNLPITGYLNQPTVVQLLADSVGQILR